MKDKTSKVTVFLIFLSVVTLALILFRLVQTAVPVRDTPPRTGQGADNAAPGTAGQNGQDSRGSARSGSAQGGSPQGGGGRGGNAQGGGGSAGGTQPGTAIRVTPVALGTVENSVIISGDVLSSSQVSIYPAMPGKLTELRVRPGDRVGRGQVIALVDPSRPGDPFYANPVTSTVSGVVLSAPVNVGETLQTGTAICVVGNLSDLQVETYVPERFSVTMHRGLPAQVSFEAMPGESFAAEVDELAPVLDPASRTMRIKLRFVPDASGRVDPRILAGMFATVSLVTNSRIDVPVIPRQALINTYGSWIVFTVPRGGGAAVRKEVTLGLENEEVVEILSGLEAGELVVTAGQNFLTDGDPVRIVE